MWTSFFYGAGGEAVLPSLVFLIGAASSAIHHYHKGSQVVVHVAPTNWGEVELECRIGQYRTIPDPLIWRELWPCEDPVQASIDYAEQYRSRESQKIKAQVDYLALQTQKLNPMVLSRGGTINFDIMRELDDCVTE